MKRVIDVSDTLYKTCQRLVSEGDPRPSESCIANSEPYEPQGDCISREALKKDFKERNIWNSEIVSAIDNAPTVEAYPFEQVQELVKLNQQFAKEIENLKRPQGEWLHHVEYTNDRLFYITECPFCKLRVHEETNFCPNCGANMQKGNVG